MLNEQKFDNFWTSSRCGMKKIDHVPISLDSKVWPFHFVTYRNTGASSTGNYKVCKSMQPPGFTIIITYWQLHTNMSIARVCSPTGCSSVQLVLSKIEYGGNTQMCPFSNCTLANYEYFCNFRFLLLNRRTYNSRKPIN